MPDDPRARPEPPVTEAQATGPRASSAEPPAGAPRAGAPPTKKRARRRRRRILILGGLAVLVLALVAAAPWIASSRAVSQYVLARLSAGLRGDLSADRVALSWFGPLRIAGLRIVDADRREVLRVAEARLAGGLWNLLAGWESFGELRIESPRVVLLLDEANRLSLAEALRPVRPAPEEPRGPLPALRGRIIVADGSLAVARGSQPAYQATALNLEFDLRTLSELRGTLDATLMDGTSLTGQWQVAGLVTDGQLDVGRASGSLALTTGRPAEIGPLAAALLGRADLAGRAGLTLHADARPGDLSARVAATLAGVQSRDRAATGAAPLDLVLGGDLTLRGGRLRATADARGAPGRVQAELAWAVDQAVPDLTAERIASALLGGADLRLPEFELSGTGALDLAALEQAVPGLLPLRPGQALTAGRLDITALRIAGGAAPALEAAVELRDLTARDAARTTVLSPVALDIRARLPAGQGLQIERGALTAAFARIQASGSAADLRAEFRSDLAALQRELAQVFDLGGLELAGEVSGTLALARADGGRIGTALELNARQTRCAAGGRGLDLPRATLQQTGEITLAEQRVTRITATELSADLNGEVVARGRGWFDATSQALAAELDLARADLGFAPRRAQGLGPSELARFGGSATGQVRLERAAAPEPLVSSGQLTVTDLTADGQPLVAGAAELAWTRAAIGVLRAPSSVESVRLDSPALALSARDVRIDPAQGSAESAQLSASADLEPLLRAVGLVARWERPPELRGRLTLESRMSTSGGRTALAGRGAIAPFEVGTGPQALRKEQLEFQYDATLDPRARRITLGQNRIALGRLAVELQGTIDKYDTEAVAALTGRYQASGQELTRLLHELAPATAELVVVEGESGSDFSLKGPLRVAGARPAFRGAQAAATFGWERAQLAGVALGPAALKPRLADGQLSLPPTVIAAPIGRLRAVGVLDFRPADPTLRIPGRHRVLEGVRITPELGRALLSRINPVFYHLASADGVAHLELEDVVLPLGPTARAEAAGRGRLELVNMKVRPDGLLAELLALGGRAADREPLAIVVRGGEFRVERNGVRYEDFTLIFPNDFDLRFKGLAGFDDTLDLVVSVPLRSELLVRLGVRGPVAEYVRLLAGTRIDLPVIGTRQQPRLDFSRVDTKALVERALKESTGDLLRDLLGRPGQEEPKRRR